MTTRFVALALAFSAAFLAPLPASGWGARTHEDVTLAAARATLPDHSAPLTCPGAPDVAAFLGYLHGALSDAAGDRRGEFLARFPGGDAAWIRDFLDLTLDPRRKVHGVDVVECGVDRATMLATEANRPDRDGRNIERVAAGPGGSPRTGTAGPFPADPAILDMGGLFGLASQAHAHYALAPDPTANPLALWTEPERFAVATAVPGGPVTLGPAMAREHFLVALLAASFEGAGSEAIALAWLGGALHYLQDAADPLHTVQVGAPCVLGRAGLAFLGRAFVTQGGVLGDLRSPFAVATDVVSNLHLWTEESWDAAGPAACIPPTLPGIAGGRPEEVLDAALNATDGAADAARPMGPRAYEHACDAASGELFRHAFVLTDGGFDPGAFRGDPEAMIRLLAVGCETTAIAARASAALVSAFASLEAWARTDEGRRALAGRLVRERLDAVAAREARLEAFVATHPEGVVGRETSIRTPWVIVAEAFCLLLVALAARRVRRARRRAG